MKSIKTSSCLLVKVWRGINWREFWRGFEDGFTLRFLWDRSYWKDFWK